MRWHGVPRRVVARHCSGWPLTSKPFWGIRSSTSMAQLT
jgi:hypothetical protein